MRHLGFVVHGKLYTGAGVGSLVRWDGLWCSAVALAAATHTLPSTRYGQPSTTPRSSCVNMTAYARAQRRPSAHMMVGRSPDMLASAVRCIAGSIALEAPQ